MFHSPPSKGLPMRPTSRFNEYAIKIAACVLVMAALALALTPDLAGLAVVPSLVAVGLCWLGLDYAYRARLAAVERKLALLTTEEEEHILLYGDEEDRLGSENLSEDEDLLMEDEELQIDGYSMEDDRSGRRVSQL